MEFRAFEVGEPWRNAGLCVVASNSGHILHTFGIWVILKCDFDAPLIKKSSLFLLFFHLSWIVTSSG